MSKEKLATPAGDRISAPLKAAALIAVMAVIALVVVSVDAPRLITAPDAPLARVAEAFVTADGPAPVAAQDAPRTTTATTPSDLHAAATTSEYFPSRFGAPKGVPEEAAPTF